MKQDTKVTYKTLFPRRENEPIINRLVLEGHRIFVFDDYILYEGTAIENDVMKRRLRGGVTAY